MSIAGKILAILNVLAAIAFLAVAGLDWGKRQQWAYAVYRHDLVLDGLPIDAQEKGGDLKPRVDKLNDQVLAAIFKTGQPVKTQADEVERVRKLVQAKVDDAQAAGTKTQKLARFLHALAHTSNERNEYARLMAAPPLADAAKEGEQETALQAALTQQLDGAKEVAPDGHKRSAEERKANAARLLYCLGDVLQDDPEKDFLTSPAFQRMLVVTGLPAAARAIDEQALVLQGMTEDVMRIHRAEVEQFLYDLSQIIYDNRSLADAVEDQERKLQAKQADVEKQKQVVTERRVQIDELTKKLANLKLQTSNDLEEQSRQEQEVMRRLIELRDTAQQNQDLEKQIRQLEGVR
jgi:hypothetical protein